MYKARFTLALVLLTSITWLATNTAFGFDLSAYYDPYSVITMNALWGNPPPDAMWGSSSSREAYRMWWQGIGNSNNQQVLNWYDSLGINILCVAYPESAWTQNWFGQHSFSAMNCNYPQRMFQPGGMCPHMPPNKTHENPLEAALNKGSLFIRSGHF